MLNLSVNVSPIHPKQLMTEKIIIYQAGVGKTVFDMSNNAPIACQTITIMSGSTTPLIIVKVAGLNLILVWSFDIVL